MASAPMQGLPMFYNQIEPLSSTQHADWKARRLEKAPFLAQAHVVPLTTDEFVPAQRHFPIVFSVGEAPVPLALMGLNEGVNVFVDAEGTLTENIYVPAYVRRYPFLLVQLRPDSEELSLCFDPSAGVLGAFDDGEPLFEGGKPSGEVQAVLQFAEQFEQAGQRTAQFMREIKDAKLLIEGELAIEVAGQAQPYIYRGFQMISEEAVNNLRGDVARKMIQSGAMALIYAHLFSLSLSRELFGRQMAQGRVPVPQPGAIA